MSREILDTINTIFSSSNDAICIHVRCRKVSSNHIIDKLDTRIPIRAESRQKQV